MLLDSLNERQKEAVLTTEGPLLILAGAGSGKTKALTTRIAYLIQEKKVSPSNILAVTFTNKAAGEMKIRIRKILGLGDDNKDWKFLPYVGTFHSICARILRREITSIGFKSNFTIYDESDRASALKKCVEQAELGLKEWRPQMVGGTISKSKSQLITADEYEKEAGDYYSRNVAKIFKLYEKHLKDNHALDFDDLINRMIEVLEKNPEILRKYQEIFKYILIDEYQDTNKSQYRLVHLLAHKHKNICVVGDDAQSIYRFRMADIQNILNFEHDFEGAKIVYLDQGYRNTKTILNAANEIIKNNKKQKKKNLWTENKEGEKINIYLAEDEVDEARFIVDKIREIKNDDSKNLKYSDFTILYRANAQSRALENEFMQAGIPYKIVGGVRYYERKEIKDVLAYLHLVNNPYDLVRLERAINIPARGIGPATVQKLTNLITTSRLDLIEVVESGLYEKEVIRKNDEVKKFVRIIKEAQELLTKEKLSDVLNFIIKRSGYIEELEKNPEDKDRIDNIKELFTVVKKYDTEEGAKSLNEFLEEIALVSAQDDIQEKNDVVNLMTIHASKGLEFRNVFIVGLEEGIFPHAQSMMEEEELEEERRLCYVAITRAIDRVFLSYADARKLYGNIQVNMPSRFISEVPKDLIEYQSYLDKKFKRYEKNFTDEMIIVSDEPPGKISYLPDF